MPRPSPTLKSACEAVQEHEIMTLSFHLIVNVHAMIVDIWQSVLSPSEESAAVDILWWYLRFKDFKKEKESATL